MEGFADSLKTHFKLMKIIHHYNICVTEIEIEERYKSFFDFLTTKNLIAYQGDETHYDYIVVDTLKSPAEIYDIYHKHNDKFVIFNTPKLFSRIEYIRVAEGGFCSSPDSATKWKVSYEGKKDFMFTGHIIILTSLSYNDIKTGGDKYKYILRDMNFVK